METQDAAGVSPVREMLSQVQAGANVATAIGQPITVGERVVIPAVEVAYMGGGGGGRMALEQGGGGGGGAVRVRPLGCWIIGPHGEIWLPALDINRTVIIAGSIATLFLLLLKALARRRR